jgi:TnpA family transposase
MRTLQVGDRPTRLAQAIAEFGRIDKTLHTLTYIDDEAKRSGTLTQMTAVKVATASHAPSFTASAASCVSITARVRKTS